MVGVNDSKISKSCSETSRYRAYRPGTMIACGQSRFATAIGCAEWHPNGRASYDAVATTPRGPSPPTRTGLPRSLGSSSCSMAAKKASMSTWRMARGLGTPQLYGEGRGANEKRKMKNEKQHAEREV